MTENRVEAFCALLALPDEDDYTRGHHLTCDGDPDAQDWWHAWLPQAWTQYQLAELDSVPSGSAP